MPGQQVRFRRQTTLTLNSFSQKQTFQLGRGMIYREIVLRLYGSFTYALAANNARATLGRADEWSAIQNVSIVVNGTDTIRSFTGTQLFMMNRLLLGGVKRQSITLGDGATAGPPNLSYDSTLVIPFWMPMSAKPFDTCIDSSKLADFRIEVTTNTSADINSANGPTAISASLDICSLESFGVDANFTDYKIPTIVQTVSAANTELQIQVPVTPVYRGFLINIAAGANQTSADSPNVLQNLQVVSGTTIFRDIPAPMLLDWQRQRTGFAREQAPSLAASPQLSNGFQWQAIVKSANLTEDAWYWFDMCNDGYLTEGIDTLGYSELFLRLNVNAGCTVTVQQHQMFPIRKAG